MIKFFKFVGGERDGALVPVPDWISQDKGIKTVRCQGYEYEPDGTETTEAQDDTLILRFAGPVTPKE